MSDTTTKEGGEHITYQAEYYHNIRENILCPSVLQEVMKLAETPDEAPITALVGGKEYLVGDVFCITNAGGNKQVILATHDEPIGGTVGVEE